MGESGGTRQTASPHAPARLHSLDALRGVALLLGLVLHSTMPYVELPGAWPVGTQTAVGPLAWLWYYLHSFRLAVFFVMAGFFGALVVNKRGLVAWMGDRVRRVLLVFVVALVPMKLVLAVMWTWGGRRTGWLTDADESTWRSAVDTVVSADLPDVTITHLWFLYYLSIISAYWALARHLTARSTRLAAIGVTVRRGLQAVLASWLGPVWLALAATPALSRMHSLAIDTPDQSLAWHVPVLAVYTLYFAVGWVLHEHRDQLATLARRALGYLWIGLLLSLVGATLLAVRHGGEAWAFTHEVELRWASSLVTSAVAAFSVLGWVGAFVRYLSRPNRALRYLADASYWIYIAHLPVMVALQVWWAGSGLPWVVQVPLVNLATFATCVASYQLLVRSTWVGAWLNGSRRRRRSRASAIEVA